MAELRPAQFLGPLRLEKHNEREWILLEPFKFYSAVNLRTYAVPAGTVTDLASIPRILWPIFPKIGRQDGPSVIHDGGCSGLLVDVLGNPLRPEKKVIDGLFYEGMLVSGVNPRKAKEMYLAVKLFGRMHVGVARV